MLSDDNEVIFRGDNGAECEDFLQQVYFRAWKEGRTRDDAWIADFVSICFRGKAVRWYAKLSLEKRRDWALLQLALLERWPSEDDETQPQAAFATPAGSSTSNGYVDTLPPSNYAIGNVSAKKVLDLAGGYTAPGTIIQIYPFYGYKNQIWMFEPSKQGYKIKSTAGTYIGFASGVQAVAGAAVTGNPTGEQWQIQRCGNTYLIVLASNPSLVIDLAEAHGNNATKIVAYPQTGESSQKWILEPKA